MNTKVRETLSSRLGFILLAAGCAIGLGNIWRFPFVVGQYGGGYFVLLYMLFLFILGIPILSMELAIGRASRRNIVGAYELLAHKNKKVWRGFGSFTFFGNLFLMMFYTTVAGWMIAYTYFYLTGELASLNHNSIGIFFDDFLASPFKMVLFMGITVLLGTLACALGLKQGVERSVKYMMILLFLILLALVIYALTLEKAREAVKFYLYPSMDTIRNVGIFRVISEALGQAFFTLSIGVGSMEIYGSYIGKEQSLTKESMVIVFIDTLIALMAGLVIFPACFTYNVDVTSGPGLVFVALPNVFNQMGYGRIIGIAFFGFMSLAALTTVIAVMENLIAYLMDEKHMLRRQASLLVGVGLFILSLPCALGFNLLKMVKPFGANSTILDLEDFIVSNNLLTVGAVLVVLFCMLKSGWGYENFIAEVDTGRGIKFPRFIRYYLLIVVPMIIIIFVIINYLNRFA